MTLTNKVTRIKLTSKWPVLFLVIFLLIFDNLESKSVLVFTFACAILSLKTSAASLLNSEVSIYLPWLWLISFFSISLTLVS